MVLTYDLPDAKAAASVMRSRLGKLAQGIRWAGLVDKTEGMSHADLVKAAESAAKRVLMSGDDRITLDHLRSALDDRRSASLAG
jgi:AAA+ superfamily predicted ATPase